MRFGPLNRRGPEGNLGETPLGPNIRAWFVIWRKISLLGNNQIIPKSLSPPHCDMEENKPFGE